MGFTAVCWQCMMFSPTTHNLQCTSQSHITKQTSPCSLSNWVLQDEQCITDRWLSCYVNKAQLNIRCGTQQNASNRELCVARNTSSPACSPCVKTRTAAAHSLCAPPTANTPAAAAACPAGAPTHPPDTTTNRQHTQCAALCGWWPAVAAMPRCPANATPRAVPPHPHHEPHAHLQCPLTGTVCKMAACKVSWTLSPIDNSHQHRTIHPSCLLLPKPHFHCQNFSHRRTQLQPHPPLPNTTPRTPNTNPRNRHDHPSLRHSCPVLLSDGCSQ